MNLKCIKLYGQLQNSFVTVQQYGMMHFSYSSVRIQDVVGMHPGLLDNACLDRNKLTAPKLVLYK